MSKREKTTLILGVATFIYFYLHPTDNFITQYVTKALSNIASQFIII